MTEASSRRKRFFSMLYMCTRMAVFSPVLQICEGEMSKLLSQLEASGSRVGTAEAAAQEARLRAQQLEAAAATAQETVERMQTANRDLITTYDPGTMYLESHSTCYHCMAPMIRTLDTDSSSF